MRKTKIVLVGYGSQGTRIAKAVSAQPDFQLVGIGLKVPDVFAHMAFRAGYPIYITSDEDVGKFKEAKIDAQGMLSDVLPRTDIAIDATPSGVGKTNKQVFYSKHNVKSIFQAGEAFEVAEIPTFMSIINYDEARASNSVRIPSPSAVSLMRTLRPLDIEFGVERAMCTLIRPGSEPMRGHHGPVDTVVLDSPYVAHQVLREEMRMMFPKDMLFASMAIPSMLLAVAVLAVDLERGVSAEHVIDTLSKIPRIILVNSRRGLHTTDAIFEYARRVARPSADIYELCIWSEHLEAAGNRVKLIQAFDPHCVQTPEIIDAIRALAGREEMQESFKRTNEALKLLSPGNYP